MSRFKWYREWRGGYWVYEHFNGWRKVSRQIFLSVLVCRHGRPEWSFEEY